MLEKCDARTERKKESTIQLAILNQNDVKMYETRHGCKFKNHTRNSLDCRRIYFRDTERLKRHLETKEMCLLQKPALQGSFLKAQ